FHIFHSKEICKHLVSCTQTANTGNSNCLKDLPLSRRFGVDLEPGMEKLPIRGRNCAVPPCNSEGEREPGRDPRLHGWPLAGSRSEPKAAPATSRPMRANSPLHSTE